jgi:hypothetical protein
VRFPSHRGKGLHKCKRQSLGMTGIKGYNAAGGAGNWL